MNKLVKTIGIIMSAAMLSFVIMAFNSPQDGQKIGGPWDIPEEYQNMTNPYADDEDLIKPGKMLYSKHCKSCHGNKGLGDGPMARQLETFPGDFSSEEFKATPDGPLYYKSFIGRDEMPNYEKKIPDEEDRWAIVNYMRSL